MPAMVFAFLFKIVGLGALGLLLYAMARPERERSRVDIQPAPERKAEEAQAGR